MEPIILASMSPRRFELMSKLGLDFQVIPSDITEVIPKSSDSPGELVTKLALHKASDVAGKLEKALVIGADTLVVLEEMIFGKPSGPDEAVNMLKALSGKTHSVYTGIAIIQVSTGQTETGYCETKVKFKPVSTAEIQSYVATGEPLDKAGAYGIQGKGGALVAGIEGCYFNIVGLPLSQLADMLQKFQVSIWRQ
ncbi:MAG: septum formation inhibitor Maf [Firmicutes bacterium]|nr:septum formation inhibitor Maf [Bacillota bacterium]